MSIVLLQVACPVGMASYEDIVNYKVSDKYVVLFDDNDDLGVTHIRRLVGSKIGERITPSEAAKVQIVGVVTPKGPAVFYLIKNDDDTTDIITAELSVQQAMKLCSTAPLMTKEEWTKGNK